VPGLKKGRPYGAERTLDEEVPSLLLSSPHHEPSRRLGQEPDGKHDDDGRDTLQDEWQSPRDIGLDVVATKGDGGWQGRGRSDKKKRRSSTGKRTSRDGASEPACEEHMTVSAVTTKGQARQRQLTAVADASKTDRQHFSVSLLRTTQKVRELTRSLPSFLATGEEQSRRSTPAQRKS
jgi:hypothetical protein